MKLVSACIFVLCEYFSLCYCSDKPVNIRLLINIMSCMCVEDMDKVDNSDYYSNCN